MENEKVNISEITKKIGNNVKELRENKKVAQDYKRVILSQVDLAKKLTITPLKLQRIEKGDFKNLNLKFFYKLSELYNVSITSFFRDIPKSSEFGIKNISEKFDYLNDDIKEKLIWLINILEMQNRTTNKEKINFIYGPKEKLNSNKLALIKLILDIDF